MLPSLRGSWYLQRSWNITSLSKPFSCYRAISFLCLYWDIALPSNCHLYLPLSKQGRQILDHLSKRCTTLRCPLKNLFCVFLLPSTDTIIRCSVLIFLKLSKKGTSEKHGILGRLNQGISQRVQKKAMAPQEKNLQRHCDLS